METRWRGGSESTVRAFRSIFYGVIRRLPPEEHNEAICTALADPFPFRMARVLQATGLTIAASAVLSLGGCASSTDASLIHLPDGQSGYAINCSGADASTTWASCYVLAGDKCGATGYTIVSKDNEEGGPSGGSITNVVSANVKNRSMVIRCN